MASRFWLIATAIWTAGIVEVDSIIHDHRVLPILVVVPVIALATRFTPRVVVAVGALDLVIATVIGFVDPNVGAARLLSTAIAITLILGLAAWVSTLRARLEDALALAREEAASDELTGLDNRRAIDRAAGRLVDGNEVVTVVMADLDYFKRVNDLHGHAVGDEVLVEVGRRLRTSVRADDLVGRYGGEEFLIILRGDEAGTAEIVERVLMSLRTSPVDTSAGPIEVRASLGVSIVTDDGLAQAIRNADRALYESKRSGRDRATTWSSATQP
ncbi:MAG TPA: GGDEF domain-containing protein [Acidimicrobiales bacterium]|nr:GGDEF domain-containing protein [Acidimicrobiales bacterium]